MSPEQADSGAVDHRTDIYALGLIFCESVTGDLPFEHADSTIQVMYQRVHATVKDPKQLNPDLPNYVARIIQKCLERDINLRYESATAVLADLDAGHAPLASSTQLDRGGHNKNSEVATTGLESHFISGREVALVGFVVRNISLSDLLGALKKVPNEPAQSDGC